MEDLVLLLPVAKRNSISECLFCGVVVMILGRSLHVDLYRDNPPSITNDPKTNP